MIQAVLKALEGTASVRTWLINFATFLSFEQIKVDLV